MTHNLAENQIAALAPIALVDRKAFADALARVSKVVERRNTIPILSNVRLAGDGESLVVEGTDLDIWHRVTIGAAADKRFAATVPAHMLRDVVKKASSEYVEACAGDVVGLDFEGARTSLQALPVSDWPLVEDYAAAHWKAATASFTLPAATLRRLFAACEIAISTEETRYYLNGVYMHATTEAGKPVFRAVATDGDKLIRAAIPVPAGAENMAGSIVPRKTVALVLAELKRKAAPESVAIEFGAAWVSFKIGAAVIRSKLVDGTFPDYVRVIPAGNDKRATVDARAFAGMVAAVSQISSERGRAVKLAFVPVDGSMLYAGDYPAKLEATVSNPDSGSASQSIEIAYSGDPMEIGFDAAYLTGLVESIGADRLVIRLADAGSPTLFEPAAPMVDGVGVLGVIMPMRV